MNISEEDSKTALSTFEGPPCAAHEVSSLFHPMRRMRCYVLTPMQRKDTVDDVIQLEKDQVPSGADTGGSEADDAGVGSIYGTDDPEGHNQEEEGAEGGEEEVPDDE
ncbi:hypothetical protein R1sor_013989 [Riccia sorocarpa]|uniref:Uncharacterized protein n=1 Tax=Riccia sorocarpa TaxID=122646 RepID=A0ABD3HBU8_9MARC